MSVEPKDVVIAILGAAVGLAGLLLVFVGFVFSRAEAFTTRRGDRFRLIAKLGVVPFIASLVCACLCMEWMDGRFGLYWWCVQSFKLDIALTAAYGTVTLLRFL